MSGSIGSRNIDDRIRQAQEQEAAQPESNTSKLIRLKQDLATKKAMLQEMESSGRRDIDVDMASADVAGLEADIYELENPRTPEPQTTAKPAPAPKTGKWKLFPKKDN